LRHDHWSVPNAVLDVVLQPHAKVAVKACHASSKTFTAADAVLLSLLFGGDVLTTAPTWTQVEQVLWGAVRRAVENSVFPIKEWGDINRTEIRLPTGEFAIGLSTDQAVRFQGYHSREDSFLLVVMDEAPGVLPGIYEAIEGISAGGDVRRLYIGNPVIASGPFYDIFAGETLDWDRYTIDAFTTPNLHGLDLDALLALSDDELDESERPYLVTRRWVYERYYEWGEDHPLWQSRVRGAFPEQSEDALISLAWLEAAKRRPAEYQANGGPEIVAGIDVAGPGEDETVCVIRQGAAVLDLRWFAHADARGPVMEMLQHWRPKGLKTVNVDDAGIGHYFLEHLKDNLGTSVTVAGINVGESPTMPDAAEKYRNLKAEMYWALRSRIRDGDFAGLTDQRTISQLAGIRYSHDARGRVQIESKDDARKRGVKSPDRAEAIALAFWRSPMLDYAAAVGQLSEMGGWRGSTEPEREPSKFGRSRDEMDAARATNGHRGW
jgi:hypothetical protein